MAAKDDHKKGASRDDSDSGEKTKGKSDHYIVNGQRVDLSRHDDLIAVVYKERAPDRMLESVPGREDLEPATDMFPEMQRGNVRIYRVTSERGKDIQSLNESLRTEDKVEKVGQVYTNQYDQPVILTDELVVKFKPDLTPGQIEEIKRKYGLETVQPLGFSENAFVLRLAPAAAGNGKGRTESNAIEVANKLLDDGYAEYSYPNLTEHIGYRVFAMAGEGAVPVMVEERHGIHPTDPLFPQQWHHENTAQVAGGVAGTPGADIRTPLAWQVTMGDPNIRLAVIDGGTDIAHNDLNAPGKNVNPIDLMVSPPDSDPMGDAHGTQVAGMAVATANNGVVGTGSAPNCRLIAVKAGDTIAQLLMAQGFVYAADHGADVITCSLGPNNAPWIMTDALREAIDYATTYGRNGRGCAYFHAVDNGSVPVSQDQVCSYERSIAVGRTNNRDLADGSARGVELDLSAPGRDVLTITNTTPGSATTSATVTGTSFATPLTAGAGALVLSVNRNLSWEEVRQVMMDSADKIDAAANPYGPAPANRPPGTRNDMYGYGRINAERAVNIAQSGSTRDVYIRDTVADTGSVPQPASGFWDSPDIWVRNADDGGTTHQDTIRGSDNFIYARISNRGTNASLPCWVRFYITSFAGTQFRYPYDFKLDTTTNPGGGTPGNLKPRSLFPSPATYLVGVQRIASVPAGSNIITRVRWEKTLIPPAVNWHPCLLIEISPHDGPAATGIHVWEDNNLGQKNITIVNARRGQVIEFPFRFGHELLQEPLVSLDISKAKVPKDWKVLLDLKDPQLFKAVISNAGIGVPGQPIMPISPITPINPVVMPFTQPVTPVLPGAIQPLVPWRIIFIEEAKIAISTGQGRAEDPALVFTFPQGSSVDVGRGSLADIHAQEGSPLSGNGDGSGGNGRALEGSRAFSVTTLDGVDMLALEPTANITKLNVPIQKAGAKVSALKIQVPDNAIPGETYTFDVAERDSKGTLVGGVRLQVNVID